MDSGKDFSRYHLVVRQRLASQLNLQSLSPLIVQRISDILVNKTCILRTEYFGQFIFS
jgi:hypothetical protein